MVKARNLFRRTIIGLMASLLIVGYPLSARADDTPAASDPTTTTAQDPAPAPQKDNEKYYYDSQTGHWNSNRWVWDPVQGKYVRVKRTDPIVIPTQPAAATDTQSPSNTNDTAGNDPSGSSATLNTDTSAAVNNDIKAAAKSGDVKIKDNTTAGNATSGNANDTANVLNCINSSFCLQGSDMATFTKDIYGDVQGDIMIDPSQFTNTSAVGTGGTPNNLTINSKQSGQINNDIGLDATSGNATVVDNTTAGDATTGNASAMANIVNVINSVIASGQSFMGTVNIYGNLDGDILMPPDVLNSLLASNAAPTVSTTTAPDGKTLTANLADNTSINNNLNLNAATGNASVKDNTTGGNATTGDASTSITLLNLTGQQVVGKDALLVFVNVMGKWVGMIVNAPQGSTAAALGGGVTGDTSANTTVNGSIDNSINNNVNLNAASGNSLVAGNTTGGNATTGNAAAGVNLVNISTSSLSLSNWLGILFINVFGSWNGSFGIDTAAGNLPPSSDGSSQVASAVKQVKVFSFRPASTSNSFAITPVVSADNPSSDSQDPGNHPVVLSASTDNNTPSTPHKKYSLFWTAGSLFFLAGILSTENAFARRKEARANFRRALDNITVQPFKRY